MAMRVSGLNSGLDTDAIVQELVSAYSTKTEKYEKEQTKLGWKQEIWEDLNKKVNAFYKSVGNLRYNSGYSLYKTSVSDSTKASVSVTGTAVLGTQKLHVLQTAQSAYLTGGQITTTWRKVNDIDSTGSIVEKYEASDAKVTSDTKMSALGFEDEAMFCLETTDENGEKVSTNISLTKDSTIGDLITQLKDAGLNASFDESNGRIFLSSKSTGANSDFTLRAAETKQIPKMKDNGEWDTDEDGNVKMEDVQLSADEIAKSNTLLGYLGLNTDTSFEVVNPDGSVLSGNTPVKIDGCDSVIVLNGVEFTSSTNNYTINGLSITANGVTDDINDLYDANGKIDLSKLTDNTAVTISTATDTQGLYDTIKDFLTSYNNIINELTKLYNADSASDYEPLTDEEKDAMSDTQIEKWETKIKDSLLRRDTNLSTLMNAMMNAMTGAIEVNGKKYSLSSFGIQTLGYLNAAENEQNAYHIDGDEDDENTANNEDDLMKALTEDPETVIEYFKQLSTNLYTAIDNQMQSTELRTRYSIYNDKELTKQYANYTTIISEWEDKVSDKEEYYYQKFSAMETALAKLQSQTSSLSGLLGS